MAPFNNKETLGLAVPNVSETRAPLKDAITIHSSEVPQTPPEELDNIEVRHDTTTAEQDLFISSPYTEHHHRLDLSTLDTQPALLARALETLNPASLHYATSPYNSALAWEVAIGKLQELCAQQGHTWTKQTFYAVAFYSKLKEGIDRDLLHQLDKESHAEAAVSGGLLKYWFGVPNEERRNLATCVWRAETDAKLGGTGPWHRRARLEARNLYEKIEFKRMDFVIDDGVSGWSIV